MQPHRIQCWADIAPAIVMAEQAGSVGLATLLRALRDGRIALLPVAPDMPAATFKLFAATTRGRPAVVLIGDDDYLERGPAGWSVARRASRWAAAVLLHAAGAEQAHYKEAIRAAQQAGRVLIVECSTTTLPAWCELIATAPQRPSTLIITPRDGAHPVLPAREAPQ